MKKCIYPALLLFLLISISCKSTPTPDTARPAQETERPVQTPQPPQPVQPPQPPPPQQVQETPSELLNRIEEARRWGIDFESPAYFPSEWEAIEARYAAARETPQSAEEYNAIADAYEDIFRKTIPLYAQAREDEIMAVRRELISTGFTRHFPEYLRKADDIALSANNLYEGGIYYRARDTAAEALSEYETLLAGAKIFLVRQEIIEHGFVIHDPENFNKADEEGQTALDEYDAGNKEAAMAKAQDALILYNIVLETGWRMSVAEYRAAAIAEKELALEEKANVASRDLYQGADSVFNQAERHLTSRNYRNAALSYIDSKERFAASRHDTEVRRLRALDAIRLAEEKIEESNETAIGAERIIEGGSR